MLPLAGAAAVLVLTGLSHGFRTDRWGTAAEVLAATARLQNVPKTAGDWEGQLAPLDERELRIAQVTGHASLQFVHRISAQKARLLVLCGRPGAIGSHTPDICFQGLGFQMEGEPVRHEVRAADGSSGKFWTARFVRPGATPEYVRVWWAWGVAGEWQAVDAPRVHFAGRPALYKMYVVSPMRAGDGDLEQDAGLQLIEAILPPLRAALSS
jgi:hypothetical protein